MQARSTELKEEEKKLIFNKYMPEQRLGEGSFGKIFVARNVQTNELFAVKIVRIYSHLFFIRNLKKEETVCWNKKHIFYAI